MLPELSFTPTSFFSHGPFETVAVTALPFSPRAFSLGTLVLLGIAVILSLAIAYHLFTYGKNPLSSLVALIVYLVGFSFFVGLVMTSGVFSL